MDKLLRSVVGCFNLYGDYVSGHPYGHGHINDTFLITLNQGGTLVRSIFQRVNQRVFTDPPALMENIYRVTSHLRDKVRAQQLNDGTRRVMTLIPTEDGCSFLQDDSGHYWRAYIFIEAASTHNTITETSQAYEAAKAFGQFQALLSDLPAPALNETIPDFHNGRKRFDTFVQVLEKDAANRAADVRKEIAFLQDRGPLFDILPQKIAAQELPLRTTHNDTKINNVMLDDTTGEGVCVIDLDTVMPGLVLYDFGDMVRTFTSPAAEDERDLSKTTMLIERFEALVKGYAHGAGDFLTSAEREQLVFSAKLIPLIIGMRFLTDFLDGDNYFKVHRDGHNLDRCRTQFRLVESVCEQQEKMEEIVCLSFR